MKGIFVLIAVVAVFGYMWYADMLPFDYQNPSSVMAPTPENIQQISNVIIPSDKKTVYYSFEDVPSIPDKQIPVNALKKAIEAWEANNPNLEFIQSENSNIVIRWQVYASPSHVGLATCNTVLFGILSHCVLDISVGDNDCNGDFVQDDESMVTNILMHEIGHSLGLGHTSETGNLMFSTESPEISFNTKGYVIPDRLEDHYVGQKALLQQEKELRAELGSLDVKISREQSEHDTYHKQMKYYEGKTSSSDVKKYEKNLNNVNSKVEEINMLIDQQNQIIDQINEIYNQLGCDPNFEIKS